MKATIEVTDRREADLIRAALDDPLTRAFVQITGALLPLSPRARTRVMQFVASQLAEESEKSSANGGEN